MGQPIFGANGRPPREPRSQSLEPVSLVGVPRSAYTRSLMLRRFAIHPLWIIIPLALDPGSGHAPRLRRLRRPRQLPPDGSGVGLGGRIRLQRTADRLSAAPVSAPPGSVRRSPERWGIRGIAILHLLLGAGTVWLTAVAAARSGLSRTRAMAAALVVAFDPVLVWQSRSVMTETPAAFLVAATLAGLTLGGVRGIVWGGLGFGLVGLCRPSMLAGAALTILAGLVSSPGHAKRRVVRARRPHARDRSRLAALDDPQSGPLRRTDLDDDSRRIHAGARE